MSVKRGSVYDDKQHMLRLASCCNGGVMPHSLTPAHSLRWPFMTKLIDSHMQANKKSAMKMQLGAGLSSLSSETLQPGRVFTSQTSTTTRGEASPSQVRLNIFSDGSREKQLQLKHDMNSQTRANPKAPRSLHPASICWRISADETLEGLAAPSCSASCPDEGHRSVPAFHIEEMILISRAGLKGNCGRAVPVCRPGMNSLIRISLL